MARKLKRIGLAFGFGLGFFRDILRGAKAFAEERPDWLLLPIAPEAGAVVGARALRLDGVIAHIFETDLANALARMDRPVVNVSGVLPSLPFPRVMVDHVAVGVLAAEHLLGQGYRRFGFVGYPDHEFSRGREAGFRSRVEAAGFELTSHHAIDPIRGDLTGLWSWNDRMVPWLRRLRRPVAVLASHDIQGVQVSEACRRAGLSVPGDVGILGVDDDDLLCALARPSLSSVVLPAERIGYEAAALLASLMEGGDPPAGPILLAPVRVAIRASSDGLGLGDPLVSSAVRFIREHPGRPMLVDEVVAALGVGRRTLERRFRSTLGYGVFEAIRSDHLRRAESLLVGSDATIAEIAVRVGFSESKHLSSAFRQEHGISPSEYRRRYREYPRGARGSEGA